MLLGTGFGEFLSLCRLGSIQLASRSLDTGGARVRLAVAMPPGDLRALFTLLSVFV